MNSQPKWDIYESVVLLNGYLLACKKSEPRAYIIRRVSADLRAMAIHRGRKIDEIFRNENGISYQMQSVDSAYKGRKIYEYESFADELTSYMPFSRKAVCEVVKVDDDVMKGIFPIHPMAALLLKHFAKNFASNQRSMFNFIKNSQSKKRI